MPVFGANLYSKWDKKQVDLCYNVGQRGNLVEPYLTQRKREDLEKNKVERTMQVEIKKKFLAIKKACRTVFCPTPGFKEKA